MTVITCLCLAVIAFLTLVLTVSGIDFIGLAPMIFYAFLAVTLIAIVYSAIHRQPDYRIVRLPRQ